MDRYIFGIIFDTVTRQEAGLTLDIGPKYTSDIKQLLYENVTTVAQGEHALMINLKPALEELISDESVKSRIKEHGELRSKLQNDPQI